jgi:hypothetical protein
VGDSSSAIGGLGSWLVRGSVGKRLSCVAVLATSACTTTIKRFEAHPNVLCAGDPTTLTWEASGPGRITASPAVTGIGNVLENGSVVVSPAQTTHFVLDAKAFLASPATQPIDVTVVTVPGPKEIGGSFADPKAKLGCDASGGPWIVATLTGDFWDAHLHVGAVTLTDRRPYGVSHGGVTVALKPGESTDRFKGQVVQGDWKLSAPLQPGETCANTQIHNLVVMVNAECGR